MFYFLQWETDPSEHLPMMCAWDLSFFDFSSFLLLAYNKSSLSGEKFFLRFKNSSVPVPSIVTHNACRSVHVGMRRSVKNKCRDGAFCVPNFR